MTFFGRMIKKGEWDRDHQGQYAAPDKAAPPPHLRDKNKSTAQQGAKATTPPFPRQAPDTGGDDEG